MYSQRSSYDIQTCLPKNVLTPYVYPTESDFIYNKSFSVNSYKDGDTLLVYSFLITELPHRSLIEEFVNVQKNPRSDSEEVKIIVLKSKSHRSWSRNEGVVRPSTSTVVLRFVSRIQCLVRKV